MTTPRLNLISRSFIASLAMVFACTGMLRSATVTKDANRRLLVNGQPFVIKGVCYSPVPVGQSAEENYPWWTNAQTYGTDLPLIRQLGANTIRVYSGASVTQPFLDAAAANGIYVIMEYWVNPASDFSNASIRNNIISGFKSMVERWMSHPAILMWSLGNEVNSTASNANWYSLLNAAAQEAHASDPDHLVTTSNMDALEIGDAGKGATDALLPALDVWGINIYRGKTFGAGFFDGISASTTKPFYVSEWGCDVYKGNAVLGEVDEAMQDEAIRQQWSEIAANLASTSGGKGCNGGTVFEWCDEWWKEPVGTKNTHDTAERRTTGGYDDPNINEEWWGICSVSAGSYARGKRLAYSSLQTLWGGSNDADVASGGISLFKEDVRNYPNPFVAGRSSTRINFSVNGSPSIEIIIYDLRGREIRRITDVATAPDGVRTADWDGRGGDNSPVDAGLYLARIRLHSASSEETRYRKIVIVK